MTLSDYLASEGVAVTARVVERELVDPFWLARYGERGRRYLMADGANHLSHLAAAMASGAAAPLCAYAQWMRGLLVARGMCSFHVVRNFRYVADELRGRDAPDHARANELLSAAAATLRHPAPVGWLDDRGDAIALAGAWRVVAATGCDPADAARDLRVLASYLTDGLALSGDRFLAHLAWCRADADQRGSLPYWRAHLATLGTIVADSPSGPSAAVLDLAMSRQRSVRGVR